jgi:NhaA family Na+:H+ antiporter
VAPGLRLFLMALAIFDDVGAIIIIAAFHTHDLSWLSIMFSGVMFLVLAGLNWAGVRRLGIYFIPGAALWLGVLYSGVHATVAGLLIALIIPWGPDYLKNSPLLVLEKGLHPWVVYGVLPLFAFANAGVSFQGMSWRILLDPVTLGIVGGLFLGKQSGVLLAVWLMVKAGWARLPAHTTWQALYGTALLCGIGFTMSLFIGTLAFGNESSYLTTVRVGVLLASLLSGVMGAAVLWRSYVKKADRWKHAAKQVAQSSYAVNKKFQAHSRIKKS